LVPRPLTYIKRWGGATLAVQGVAGERQLCSAPFRSTRTGWPGGGGPARRLSRI